VIDKAKADMNDLKREVQIMSQIKHTNVIALYEIYDEPKKQNLVMELVTGGELFDRIIERGQYTEKDAAFCIKQLCDALDYLHGKGIVHRDLKPENLLYKSVSGDDKDILSVADFGLARVVPKTSMMKTACGTPGYVAPEILENKGYDSGACDVWSAGVILYVLLCGFPPFYEEEMAALFDQIKNAKYDFPDPYWTDITDGAKTLVTKCLQKDADARFTAKQVLEDSWIKGGGTEHDLAAGQQSLKKYNATRKLKKALVSVQASQRLGNMIDQIAKA